jgi:hypothetical protein
LTWLKIKHPNYTQMDGRAELFERRCLNGMYDFAVGGGIDLDTLRERIPERARASARRRLSSSSCAKLARSGGGGTAIQPSTERASNRDYRQSRRAN